MFNSALYQGASEHVQLGPLFNSFGLVRTHCPCRLDFQLHSLCFHRSSPLSCHPCRHERTQEEIESNFKKSPDSKIIVLSDSENRTDLDPMFLIVHQASFVVFIIVYLIVYLT